jgi:hypothetical protein
MRYPLFILFRYAVRINYKNKDESIFNGERSYFLYGLERKDIAYEVACRYVRLYKPMAYKSEEINRKLSCRYNNRSDPIPKGFGVLTVNKAGYIHPTVERYDVDDSVYFNVMDYRYEYLKKILSKKNHPSGKELDVKIMLIEFKEYIDAKARICRKKSYSTAKP